MKNTLTGIYEIRNTLTDSVYIGSSVNVRQRFVDHRKHLCKGTHTNNHLQNAWNKYGRNAFTFTIICECGVDELIVLEQQALDSAIANVGRDSVMNICLVVETSRLGLKVSDESRARMSASKRGRRHTEQSRKNMGDAHRGLKRSESAKLKTAEKHRGMKRSEDARRRWSEQRKGKIISAECREKLSRALKGRAFSAEHREKCTAGLRAYHAAQRSA